MTMWLSAFNSVQGERKEPQPETNTKNRIYKNQKEQRNLKKEITVDPPLLHRGGGDRRQDYVDEPCFQFSISVWPYK